MAHRTIRTRLAALEARATANDTDSSDQLRRQLLEAARECDEFVDLQRELVMLNKDNPCPAKTLAEIETESMRLLANHCERNDLALAGEYLRGIAAA